MLFIVFVFHLPFFQFGVETLTIHANVGWTLLKMEASGILPVLPPHPLLRLWSNENMTIKLLGPPWFLCVKYFHACPYLLVLRWSLFISFMI